MAKSKDLNPANNTEQLRSDPQATKPSQAVAAKVQAGQAALLRSQTVMAAMPEPTPVKAKRAPNKLLGLPEEEVTELSADGTYTPVAEGQGVQVAQVGQSLPESVTSAASDAAGSATSAGTTSATSASAGAATGPATGAATGGAGLGASTLAMVGGGLAVAAGLGGGGSKSAAPQTAITVLDGRIKNASVYVDTNNNGTLEVDADTKVGTTDEQGVLKVDAAAVAGKTLLTTGGVDISTGVDFTGVMKALAGASIVSPLTTLVHAVATSQSSNPTAAEIAAAEAKVKEALGLSGVTESLQNYNPLAVLEASGSSTAAQNTAQAVLKAAIQVANLISVAASAVKAEDAASTTTAAQATFAQLGTAIADASGSYDLSNAANITAVLSAAGLNANVTVIADTIAASNTQIAASADLAAVVQVQTVAQGTVAALVEQANYAALSDYDSAAEVGSVAENVVNSSSLSISSNKTILKAGDAATLTFKFSKAPTGFDLADIDVEAGQGTVSDLSAVSTNSTTGEVTYTATFTPSANIKDSAVTISVAGAAYTVSGSAPQDAKTALPVDTQVPSAPTLALGTGVSNGATSLEATATGGAVTVAAESGATLQVTFTNGSKTVIKTLTGTGVAQAVTLTSDDLNKLGNGTVEVSAVVTDAAGNASDARTASFVLDTAVPEAPTLAQGTGVTGGATSAEATAAGGVVTVLAETGASVVVTFTNDNRTVSKTVQGNGNTPVAVELSTDDLSALHDGTISVSAIQTDAAGNASSAGTTSFVLDTAVPSAPTLALGGDFTGGATSAEATAAGGAVTVLAESGASVEVNFTNGNRTVSKTVQGNGNTPVVVVLSTEDLSALHDGTISVSAVVKDAAGNTSTATTSFVLDTAAPEAPTLALGTGVTGGATSAEATAAGGAVTVLAETGASVAVTFTNGNQSLTKTVPGNGTTPVAVTLSSEDLNALHDGTISVSAIQTDAAGNASSAGTTSFELDTAVPSAPTLALGAGFTGGATSAEATAAGGAVTVLAESGASVEVTFTNGDRIIKKTVQGNGNTPVAVVLSTDDLSALHDGTISVSATATDAAGNTSSADAESFGLDTTAPTAPVLALGTGVSDGANVYEASANGVVTVKAESGASTVVTFSNGSKTVIKTVLGNGDTPVALQLTGADLSTLGEGTISVSATATDAAGNASSAGTGNFTYSSDINLSTVAAGTGGFVMNGDVQADSAGSAVSSAGDVNGDGWMDVIVSSLPNTSPATGKAYVVFGGSNPTSINLSAVEAGTVGFVINPGETGDSLGVSVSSVGDINGDGLADLLVGAKAVDTVSGTDAGRSYVVYGRTGGNVTLPAGTAGMASSDGFVINGLSAGDATGISVSAAGDVNGDGWMDMIVGASAADPNGNTSAGASYVVFGNPAGAAVNLLAVVNGSYGFVINGATASNYTGSSVSSAGDVNGDGLADLLVGAWGSSVGADNQAGRAFVVFGKTGGTAINLPAPTDGMAASVGFAINGYSGTTKAGKSLSSAGDVNGDGLADVVVSTDSDTQGVFVVFGRSGGDVNLTNLTQATPGSEGFMIRGESASDSSISPVVSSAGDINGDGLSDLVVSAYQRDANGLVNSGRTYVVFGKTSNTAIDLTAVAAGVGGFVINGQAADDYSGYSVSDAGDVNGDGYADLLVGARFHDANEQANSGRAYVIYGGPQFVNGAVAMGAGTSANELVVGTTGADTLTGGGGVDNFSAGAGNDTVVLTASDVSNLASNTVANVKANVDGGSGLDTLQLTGGASLDLTAISNVGAMTGGAGMSMSRINSIERIDMSTDTAVNTLTLAATDVKDMAAMNLIHTGTPSADGKTWTNVSGTPLAATTPLHQLVVDGTSVDAVKLKTADMGWVGRVNDGTSNYEVYQSSSTNTQVLVKQGVGVATPNINLNSVALGVNGFVINAERAWDQIGYSIAPAGDVNGDGFADIIVGAYSWDASGYFGAPADVGKSYVVFGRSSGVTVDLTTMLNNSNTNGFSISGVAGADQTGYSVSSAGDINGDGLADLLISANLADPSSRTNAGNSYVVYGKTSSSTVSLNNIASSNGFVIKGAAASNEFGSSVSSAGDVDGDGLADLLVGAKGAGSAAGASYVLFGKALTGTIDVNALAASQGFAIIGAAANDSSGIAVSSAGDFNGDGLADLLIGASGSDPSSRTDAGAAYVVYGKTGGDAVQLSALVDSQGMAIYGAAASNGVGFAVSAAGDVNGDGLADVIIGAKASGANASYVVFGRRDLTGTSTTPFDLATLASASSNGFAINGYTTASNQIYAGLQVSSAGDINGDGLADLLLHSGTDSSSNLGKAYVVFGNTGGVAPISLSQVETGVGGFVITPTTALATKWDVAAAGDLNGDGYADLLVGTPSSNANGSAYAIYGGPQFATVAVALGTGTSANERVVGTRGADTLTGGGGVDNFSAGDGNDTVVLTATDVSNLTNNSAASVKARVDGGGDFDTLRLTGGASLDLTVISNVAAATGDGNSRINSIERIDLATDTAVNTLKLTGLDVADMAGMNLIRDGLSADGKTWSNLSGTALGSTTKFHQLVVDGTASDVVNFVGVAGWSSAGTVSDGTSQYTVYQNVTRGAQVLVQSGVTVNQNVAPVVLDLNGDGVLQYGQTRMDVNGDGVTDLTAWAGAQDGVLVHDANGDGKVNGAAEFAFARHEGETDLQGLAAQFDSHRDGVLDMLDAQFAEFAVWQDANGNGVSDAGELHSLSALGITAMGLVSDGVQRTPAAGVTEAGRTSAQLLSGTQMLVSDASFTFAAAPAQADPATAVMALFDGAGSGAASAAAQCGPVVGVNACAQADLLLQQALLLQSH